MFRKMWRWLSERAMYCIGITLYFIVGLSATIIDSVVCKCEKLWKGRYSKRILSGDNVLLKIMTLLAILMVGLGIAGVVSVNQYFNRIEMETAQINQDMHEALVQSELKFRLEQEKARFREEYAPVLEKSFRDNHMRVITFVSGNSNEKMRLTCIFFDSGWKASMEKNGLVDIWRKMGFKKVTLTDSFGYSYTWTL